MNSNKPVVADGVVVEELVASVVVSLTVSLLTNKLLISSLKTAQFTVIFDLNSSFDSKTISKDLYAVLWLNAGSFKGTDIIFNFPLMLTRVPSPEYLYIII